MHILLQDESAQDFFGCLWYSCQLICFVVFCCFMNGPTMPISFKKKSGNDLLPNCLLMDWTCYPSKWSSQNQFHFSSMPCQWRSMYLELENLKIIYLNTWNLTYINNFGCTLLLSHFFIIVIYEIGYLYDLKKFAAAFLRSFTF